MKQATHQHCHRRLSRPRVARKQHVVAVLLLRNQSEAQTLHVETSLQEEIAQIPLQFLQSHHVVESIHTHIKFSLVVPVEVRQIQVLLFEGFQHILIQQLALTHAEKLLHQSVSLPFEDVSPHEFIQVIIFEGFHTLFLPCTFQSRNEFCSESRCQHIALHLQNAKHFRHKLRHMGTVCKHSVLLREMLL